MNRSVTARVITIIIALLIFLFLFPKKEENDKKKKKERRKKKKKEGKKRTEVLCNLTRHHDVISFAAGTPHSPVKSSFYPLGGATRQCRLCKFLILNHQSQTDHGNETSRTFTKPNSGARKGENVTSSQF